MDFDGKTAADLTFALIAAIVFLTWFYLARQARTRDGTMWNKYGPLWTSMVGGLLMLAEPIRLEWHNAGLIHLPAAELGD